MLDGEFDPGVDEFFEKLVSGELALHVRDIVSGYRLGRAFPVAHVAQLKVGTMFLWVVGVLTLAARRAAGVELPRETSRSHLS